VHGTAGGLPGRYQVGWVKAASRCVVDVPERETAMSGTGSAVTLLLDRLEAAGLVTRGLDGRDRRARIPLLTAAGRRPAGPGQRLHLTARVTSAHSRRRATADGRRWR
jgi:hypothetical protein